VTDFYRTAITDDNFIRGAGRLMYAAISQTFPTAITDIISVSNFDAQSGWSDLGATKTGIQITVNNTEETFDVDQILGDIDSRPSGWDVEVVTQLAEVTLAHMQLAWEGGTISGSSPGNQSMGVGVPNTYTRRRLAVLFQKSNGNIRAYVFRRVQRTPQESTINFAKTGEQQQIPIRFRALADTSIPNINERLFVVLDQTS
jgi:hypothetical protein